MNEFFEKARAQNILEQKLQKAKMIEERNIGVAHYWDMIVPQKRAAAQQDNEIR
jgi:hypothetical protein